MEADTEGSSVQLRPAGPWRGPGPGSLKDAFNFPPNLLVALSAQPSGAAYIQNLKNTFKEPFIVNTDFSGMGGCEMAMHMIQAEVQKLEEPATQKAMRFWRACDQMRLARKVLKSKAGPRDA